MDTITVRIRELSNHWRILWQAEETSEECVETAAEALGRVQEVAAAIAERGQSTIITIEWMPTTRIGQQVVRAIQ